MSVGRISCLEVMAVSRKSGKAASGGKISDGLAGAAVLFVCFCGAGIAGCLAVSGMGADGVSSLGGYLSGYLSLVTAGDAAAPSVWSAGWELCRWPLLAFLLGFTALGAAALPVVFCIRGFLLGYAVAAFVRVFGSRGLLLAFAVFGMTALVSVPVLFCVGCASFRSSLGLASGMLAERRTVQPLMERLGVLIPCGGLLLLAVVLQCSLMPQILAAVSGSVVL